MTSPTEVPPSSVVFVTADGVDIHDDKLTLEDANIHDGDVIKYKVLKLKVSLVFTVARG